jgi:hypothetical protein
MSALIKKILSTVYGTTGTLRFLDKNNNVGWLFKFRPQGPLRLSYWQIKSVEELKPN